MIEQKEKKMHILNILWIGFFSGLPISLLLSGLLGNNNQILPEALKEFAIMHSIAWVSFMVIIYSASGKKTIYFKKGNPKKYTTLEEIQSETEQVMMECFEKYELYDWDVKDVEVGNQGLRFKLYIRFDNKEQMDRYKAGFEEEFRKRIGERIYLPISLLEIESEFRYSSEERKEAIEKAKALLLEVDGLLAMAELKAEYDIPWIIEDLEYQLIEEEN